MFRSTREFKFYSRHHDAVEGSCRLELRIESMMRERLVLQQEILYFLVIEENGIKDPRSTPVTTTPAPTETTTTSVTNAQLQAMIDQGVTPALGSTECKHEWISILLLGCIPEESDKLNTEQMDKKVHHHCCKTEAEEQKELKTLPKQSKPTTEQGRTSGRPYTADLREMPTMLTIRGALGQARNLLAYEVAPAKVYVVGHAGTNPDSNIMTYSCHLNNRYASILFDTGADRSFVSTAFSSQMDITPSTLDHYYDVELADQKLCSAPILALPEESKDFIAYCDASKKGLGTMLMQREKVDCLCIRQQEDIMKRIYDSYLELGAVVFAHQDLEALPV
ncbi:putative reverse transcriptase domain-containing protein [Tanacetum coccineum]